MSDLDHIPTAALTGDAEADRVAMDRMFILVYDDLRALARRQLRGQWDGPCTLTTTALVQRATCGWRGWTRSGWRAGPGSSPLHRRSCGT